MSRYSADLHRAILSYPQFNETLNDSNVQKIHYSGFNAVDLSGVSITKTGEPPVKNKADALISIIEIKPLEEFIDGKLLRKAPELDEKKVVVATDYVRSSKGNFSFPEQRISTISPEGLEDDVILKSLSRAVNTLIKNLIYCEKSEDNDLIQINAENMLGSAYKELDLYISEKNAFIESMGKYDASTHRKLYKKLGALVLF